MDLLKVLSVLVVIVTLEIISASNDFSNNTINNDRESEEKTKILSRKKRYLVFPTGSSFSVATCMTIGIYGNPQFSIFSWGLNWGFAYDLPTNSSIYKGIPLDRIMRSTEVETPPMSRRRHRRNVYNKMETIMDAMGYDGRTCILRALCESSQFFGAKGTNLITELIRTVFSFPRSKTLPFEHPEMKVYDAAHRVGKTRRNIMTCSDIYSSCGFSLIKLALGHYAKPLQGYM